MKQVYLVKRMLDDPHYPAEVLTVHASERTANAQVSAYVANCAQRSDLHIDHECFWDDFPLMFVEAYEVFE